MTLMWTASSDNVRVAGYYIDRNGNDIATTTGTSYTDAGLVSGRTYKYHLIAYDAAGNKSVASATVSGKAK